MGIDINGGIIVGEIGSKLVSVDAPDGLTEWAEYNGMETMSTYYDADSNDCYYGFAVPDILVSDIDQAWIDALKAKAQKFEQMTKIPARLIGTQNVW